MNFFLFFMADIESVSAISPTAIIVIVTSILVAVGTAFALNRAAHAKKEIRIADPNALKKDETSYDQPVSSGLREKLSRLPVRTPDREATLNEISKIVEEETETRLKEVKQEYSVKYQVMIQEWKVCVASSTKPSKSTTRSSVFTKELRSKRKIPKLL
jgi:hypothetical protein